MRQKLSPAHNLFSRGALEVPVTQYFFHILDGSELFADDVGKSLSNSEEAINQARCLAAELSKAGEFCRSNIVLVVDERGQQIFECRAS